MSATRAALAALGTLAADTDAAASSASAAAAPGCTPLPPALRAHLLRYHGNLLPAYAMLTAADRAVPPAGAPGSPRQVEAQPQALRRQT